VSVMLQHIRLTMPGGTHIIMPVETPRTYTEEEKAEQERIWAAQSGPCNARYATAEEIDELVGRRMVNGVRMV